MVSADRAVEGILEPVAKQAGTLGIGQRLRRVRRMRGLTLQQVASEAKMSHSFLSMLERGLVDISLARLQRLADVYGIRLADLLVEADDAEKRPTIITAGDMLEVDRGAGIEYRYLSSNNPTGLQLIHAKLEGGSSFTDVVAHPGYDFCWVVRGNITLLYGAHEYTVRTSEVAIFDGLVAHTVRNDTPDMAEFIAVTTVPYW